MVIIYEETWTFGSSQFPESDIKHFCYYTWICKKKRFSHFECKWWILGPRTLRHPWCGKPLLYQFRNYSKTWRDKSILGINWRTILKKWGVRMWNGLIWMRIFFVKGHWKQHNELLGFTAYVQKNTIFCAGLCGCSIWFVIMQEHQRLMMDNITLKTM